ncbi:hypothetical protein NDU88_001292 [Pleurodeles waltl]|uniref:Uncharacterized protein n=1 Tax=Pleurodeles waltl TaxID=8319 RepID=A0AAV7S706_PLEWA|nr:hypothetical protein NDU88_001292 [Pleurodeles waltl]
MFTCGSSPGCHSNSCKPQTLTQKYRTSSSRAPSDTWQKSSPPQYALPRQTSPLPGNIRCAADPLLPDPQHRYNTPITPIA